MSNNNEGFLFKDEVIKDESNKAQVTPWKMLIVDDEPDIHMVTEMALDEFEFKDRNLEILKAYSGDEARNVLALHDDIALVLLDVVMETQHAGLDTAKWIREELKNDRVQIVLRTGQAGDTPEKKVIAGYDINGYREKSELTAQKLFSTLCTSFRTYQSISDLQKNNQALQQIITVHHALSTFDANEALAANALSALTQLLTDHNDVNLNTATSVAALHQNNQWEIVAGTGKYQNIVGQTALSTHPLDFDTLFTEKNHAAIINGDTLVVSVESKNLQQAILVIEGITVEQCIDISLLQLFAQNLALNLSLNEALN